MTILITGVAGLIGARLADWIFENHPEITVIGIDSMFGGYEENINKKVVFYKRDLAVDQIDDIFKAHDIQYVYHFAAYAAEGLSPFIRKFNYSNNVLSTVNIINACINYNVVRLVYTSSMSVYGHGDKKSVFNEDDICAPIDPYGISKYACELDIKVANEQHDLDYCIIRPHNVFGIKQNIWDKYRNVLGIWINNVLNNQPILIYGDGTQTRAFTYIDNILECLFKSMFDEKCSKQTINLGGIVPMTLNDIAKLTCKITGYDNVVHVEPRHEVKFAVPTYQKSIDLLGYNEKYDIEYGLRTMFNWAKTQPRRSQYKWPTYEINKKIYSYWK